MAFIRGSSLVGMGSLVATCGGAQGALFVGGSQGLMKGGALLEKTIRENISKTCHSLKQLADMGHPYSFLNPNNPHPEKPYIVHRQTGQLLSSLRSGTRVTGRGVEAWVGIDESVAPYARCLIEGTPRMISRDFLSESREEVRGEISEIMKAGFGKVLLGAAMFYQLAHIAKWASKFVGGARVASSMYKVSRFARTAEVVAQGAPHGLSRRFLNVTLMGTVAKRFSVPGGGSLRVGGAVVNKFITQEFSKRLFRVF